MKPKTIYYAGALLVFFSIAKMIYIHEFAISSVIFLTGIILIGYGHAKSTRLPMVDPKEDASPKINTEQIQHNLQTLNDILWGKKQ
jgi:hypothetical protein